MCPIEKVALILEGKCKARILQMAIQNPLEAIFFFFIFVIVPHFSLYSLVLHKRYTTAKTFIFTLW
jgi:hypothetical protein